MIDMAHVKHSSLETRDAALRHEETACVTGQHAAGGHAGEISGGDTDPKSAPRFLIS
jgi:hypothetical protein